jgi:hypothetical protein
MGDGSYQLQPPARNGAVMPLLYGIDEASITGRGGAADVTEHELGDEPGRPAAGPPDGRRLRGRIGESDPQKATLTGRSHGLNQK